VHGEAEPVHGHGPAVVLGQLVNFDHVCAFLYWR
jgi:hypothetical protein